MSQTVDVGTQTYLKLGTDSQFYDLRYDYSGPSGSEDELDWSAITKAQSIGGQSPSNLESDDQDSLRISDSFSQTHDMEDPLVQELLRSKNRVSDFSDVSSETDPFDIFDEDEFPRSESLVWG